MKQFKRSFTVIVFLTVIIGSRASAQQFCHSGPIPGSNKAKQVFQFNEYTWTGYEKGSFFCNPLMLDRKPFDYDVFNISSKGVLTLIKGTSVPGYNIEIPYSAYLRRNGNIVFLPVMVKFNSDRTKMELSEILRFALPGDQLVIQPVRKEDGPAKRILKIVGGGC